MRAWLTRQRLVELGISAVVVTLVIELMWAPTGHDVHTPGAFTVGGVRIAGGDTRVTVLANLRPSMSLEDMRCQVWQVARNAGCPDATTLSLAFWPALKGSPQTLYVGLSTKCAQYDYVYGFNVEYLPVNRRLTIHCYSTAGWIPIPFSSSCRGICPSGPMTALILVPTDAISPGMLTVIRDDRIEHLVGDQSTEVRLGTLTVS